MGPLTPRLRQLLDYLKSHIYERGYAPTYRELAGTFGWKSVNTAYEMVRKLEDRGYLIVHPRMARGITLPDMDEADGTARAYVTTRLLQGWGLWRIMASIGEELPDTACVSEEVVVQAVKQAWLKIDAMLASRDAQGASE